MKGAPGERIYIVGRVIAGLIAFAGMYISYRYIPLGESSAISFTSPVPAAILARLMLGEAYGWLQAATSIVSVIGVLLIAGVIPTGSPRPDDGHSSTDHIIGYCLAAAAAFGMAFIFVFLRRCQVGIDLEISDHYIENHDSHSGWLCMSVEN